MKIEGTGGVKNTGKANKKKTNKSDGTFSLFTTEKTETKSGVTGISPLASIDSLLSVQEIDSNFAMEREIEHGNNLLDSLEDIRMGLLNGSFSPSQVQNLINNLQHRRNDDIDDELKEIIDEIELRAEIELTKISLARK